MGNVTCREIFNGVYINVRGSYISNLYSAKTKSNKYKKNTNEDENLEINKTNEPEIVYNIKGNVVDISFEETTTEALVRQEESEVLSKIRLDLDEKVPYVIASFCSNLSTLDKVYRKWKGYKEQNEFSAYMLEQDEEFPLSERFVYPCIMYISSMVLIDIDEKMSDAFYEKYASLVSLIAKEIPLDCLSTVEKYPH